MNTYLISYDLRNPDKDYTPLFSSIRELGEYKHILSSVWLVSTSTHDENSIYKVLGNKIDNSDMLIIIQVNPNRFNGYLPMSVIGFIKDRQQSSFFNQNHIQ